MSIDGQTPVPLSLAHPDGAGRKRTKRPVMNVINTHLNTKETPALPPTSDNTYMVGLMAFIITIFRVLITYSDLAKAIIRLPYG